MFCVGFGVILELKKKYINIGIEGEKVRPYFIILLLLNYFIIIIIFFLISIPWHFCFFILENILLYSQSKELKSPPARSKASSQRFTNIFADPSQQTQEDETHIGSLLWRVDFIESCSQLSKARGNLISFLTAGKEDNLAKWRRLLIDMEAPKFSKHPAEKTYSFHSMNSCIFFHFLFTLFIFSFWKFS